MKILYFGGIVENELINCFEKKGIEVDYSANNFQLKLLKGFKNENLDIINLPFINSKRIKFIKSFEYQINNYRSNSVAYIYIPYIKNVFKFFSLKNRINNVKITDYDTAIFYSLNSYFLKISKLLKERNPSIKIVFIIPDIPIYMNTSNKKDFIYYILKQLDWKLIKSKLNVIDLSVTFTAQMYKDFFQNSIQNNFVMNGIIEDIYVDVDFYEELKINYKNKIIIAYTGTVNKQYGIEKLIQIMKYLDEKFVLLICGSGDREKYLKEINMENIVYYGKLSHEKACSIIKSANILINPRESSLIYDSYCFPSKLMEYIAAKKKIIVFKSKAMDRRYDNIFYYFNSNNPKDMATMIEQVYLDNKKNYLLFENNLITEYNAINIVKEIHRILMGISN